MDELEAQEQGSPPPSPGKPMPAGPSMDVLEAGEQRPAGGSIAGVRQQGPPTPFGQGTAAQAEQKALADYIAKAGQKVPWWKTGLGMALSATQHGRGIAPMLMQPRGLPQAERVLQATGAAAELERKQQAAASGEATRLRQMDLIDAQKQAALAARDSSLKPAPTITERIKEAMAAVGPDGKPLYTPDEIKMIGAGWKPPAEKADRFSSSPQGIFNTGTGEVKTPAPEKPQPKQNQDINHWIAVRNDPKSTPEEKTLANTNIKDWEGTQKNQRAPIVNVNAMPSDPAIDQAAMRYLKSGELPTMGMGRDAATARTKILNRAAELDPSADIASNKGGYGADKASLASLQKTADTVNAFEGLARKNLDRFVTVAQKTVDSGMPWANRAFRGGARALGDKSAAEFEAARVTAFTEIAKVLNNPTSSAVLSDSARREAEGILSGSYTIPQLVSVATLIKQEMATRKTENQRALDEIRGRMKGGKKEGSEDSGGNVVKWGRDAQGNPVRLSQ